VKERVLILICGAVLDLGQTSRRGLVTLAYFKLFGLTSLARYGL